MAESAFSDRKVVDFFFFFFFFVVRELQKIRRTFLCSICLFSSKAIMMEEAESPLMQAVRTNDRQKMQAQMALLKENGELAAALLQPSPLSMLPPLSIGYLMESWSSRSGVVSPPSSFPPPLPNHSPL